MRIRELRLELGLSQVELAQCLGVKQSSVSIWEKGDSTPSMGNLRKLAKLFNCTLDFLCPEQEQVHSSKGRG